MSLPTPDVSRPQAEQSRLHTRQFDLLAFDWDGTLFDSTAIITRSIQLAVRDVGGTVPSDKEAAYVIGMALNQALAHAAPDVPPEKYPELGARYRHHYTARQNDLSLFPGVIEMLAELKARSHWLAVATGAAQCGVTGCV
jgi:phosphoglycolate phosphatase